MYTLSDPSPNGLSVTEHMLPLRQSARLKQKQTLSLASDRQSDPAKSLGVDLATPIGFSGVLGQNSQQPLESQSTETETNKNSVLVATKNNTIGSDTIQHHINNVNDNSVHTSSLLTNNTDNNLYTNNTDNNLYTSTTDNNPHTAHSEYRQRSIGGQRQHYNLGGNGDHQGIGEFYKQKATNGYTD